MSNTNINETPTHVPVDSIERSDLAARRESKSSSIVGVAIGLAAMGAFYVTAPVLSRPFAGGPELIQRYFCGHPLEYVTSGLFFVGMGILWTKLRRLPAEKNAVRTLQDLAILEQWQSRGRSTGDVVTALKSWLGQRRAAKLPVTSLSRRVDEVLQYVTHRQSGSFEDHLRYLADLASDRLLQSYSLIRTVTWAIPIMGFLGTVVGITMAIANVTPEQLDSSLPEVTSGLAVAFDTTAQALGISMVLVFATFLVERGEQTVLSDVEQLGIDHLVPVLSEDESSSEKKNAGVPAVAEWTAQLLSRQTEFWNRHLASLQSGWAESLHQQTQQLSVALNEETEQTLKLHRESVSVSRDSYAHTLLQSTQYFTEQMQQTMLAFVDRVDQWQNAMQATSLSAAGQAEELHRLGRTMLQLTESEQRLVQLQETLDRNLQTLQLVETLEQTVSSINAAVSIMTAKTSLRSAA